MSFSYQRRYTGPVQAVIFDWAGTTVDFGSRAPIQAFMALFEANQVPISEAEARGPMGMEKRDHIAAVLALPRVSAAWQSAQGSAATSSDIDRLYADFLPYQLAAIGRCAQLLPGAKEIFAELRARGCKIGSNTGYARIMLDALAPLAAAQGYEPDSTVTASDVGRGRPSADMLWKNMAELRVENAAAAVKVDDTVVGIEEGLNAGCWTVGVAISGNEVGLSLQEWQALDASQQEPLRQRAYQRLRAAGAHYVIDSLADLMPVINDIERRLGTGERP